MRFNVYLGFAAGLFALWTLDALALPAVPQNSSRLGMVQLAADRNGERHNNRGSKHRSVRDRERDFGRSDAYERYRDWQRYTNRPDDWRDRACVTSQQSWFCPKK